MAVSMPWVKIGRTNGPGGMLKVRLLKDLMGGSGNKRLAARKWASGQNNVHTKLLHCLYSITFQKADSFQASATSRQICTVYIVNTAVLCAAHLSGHQRHSIQHITSHNSLPASAIS
jgi:hypothetical protein